MSERGDAQIGKKAQKGHRGSRGLYCGNKVNKYRARDHARNGKGEVSHGVFKFGEDKVDRPHHGTNGGKGKKIAELPSGEIKFSFEKSP